MPYEIEETGPLTRTATVTVPNEEFRSRINDALRDLKGEVDISGFRKGKVPMSVLRSRYGDRVQPEVVENLIREHIEEIGEEYPDRLIHLGETNVTNFPTEENPLEFEVDLELKPDLDPVGYMGLEVEQPEPEVADEEVDERLEEMREEFARMEPIELRETVREGDVVTFDFEPVDSDDERLDDFTGEDIEAEIGAGQVLPEIEAGLEGAELNSTLTVDIDADEEFPIEELRGREIPLRLDIKSVKQKVLPRLDDEFAKDTGEAETLLELRSQVREELREEKQHRAEHLAMENLIDELLEQNDVPIPPKFLEQQVDQEIERREEMFEQQGLDPAELDLDTEEMREGTREEIRPNLQQEFLLLAIAEKEAFEVEEEDIDRFLEHQASHDERFSAEQLKQFMRQNEEQWENVQYQALMEKTKSFLLEEADLVEAPWPDQPEPGMAPAEGQAADEDGEQTDDDTDDE
ncbi:MAG: trigger factor [Bradymonadaceae bacterium]